MAHPGSPPAQPFRSLPVAPPGRRWPGALGLTSLVIAALLALPVFAVLAQLFQPAGDGWSHLAATVLPDYIATSLGLVLLVAFGVIFGGVATAWFTAVCEFPGRRIFEWALILPLAVPAYVMAYAYTDLLQYAGPVQTTLREWFGWQTRADYWFPDIRSLGGAAVMFSLVLYPYVYMLARVAFLEQSSNYIEAGRTFGFSTSRIFATISLPLARPAIAAGTALALMETLADFGTVSYFGIQTFTTGIYRAWYSMGDPVSAAKLSIGLLCFVALVLFIERLSRRGAGFHQTGKLLHERIALSGWKAAVPVLICATPLILGFLFPCLLLARMALTDGDAQFGTRFIRLTLNSVTLAGITAVIAVALALLLAYALRLNPSPTSRLVNRMAGLGYAVPGSVIAVGVLIPVTWLDHRLSDFLQSVFGLTTGLVLTGGIAALIYGYVIRFLAVALQSTEAGLAKITPSMDDAARSLGCGPVETAMRVHVPMLKGSLVTAGLLVFVDVMKELPATFVMRPFNFDTLAVQAYNLAADERLSEASTAALAIVLVGLIPVLLASRAITRKNS
ncbi:MAG: iron ABC transporter permease [Betaproteobacteria bacterium]|nr:iron ABC transporter permease [Betaproteobacteria bacterium]